jgi:hypothetical protein
MHVTRDAPIQLASISEQTAPEIEAAVTTMAEKSHLADEKYPMPKVVEVTNTSQQRSSSSIHNSLHAIIKFFKFMGPGAVISVAYIDPDNFQTAISAGAQFKYKLLFMILLSNIIAVYLQVSEPKFNGDMYSIDSGSRLWLQSLVA